MPQALERAQNQIDHDTAPTGNNSTQLSKIASELGKAFSAFGIEIVGVEGSIQSAAENTEALNTEFAELKQTADDTDSKSATITNILNESSQSIVSSSETMRSSRNALGDATAQIDGLVNVITEMSQQIQGLKAALENVSRVSETIDQIASQTNLLALNATIEAARAGEAGKGFAVVASEVKALSGQTSAANKQIHDTLMNLTDNSQVLIRQGNSALESVNGVRASTQLLEGSMTDLAMLLENVSQSNGEVSKGVSDIITNNANVSRVIGEMQSSLKTNHDVMTEASTHIHEMVERSDRLVESTVKQGLDTLETRFYKVAQDQVTQIEAAFETALSTGQTTMDDLFDTKYQPIKSSNPEQLLTRYTELTDRLLPPIQEPVLDIDSRITFCACVDRNGYLPTHNLKFSKPQGNDPVWNAANSRNRRIFDDTVGLKAGQNTAPFLIQTYKRDMGGGKYAIMKDLSVPIMIKGRHWGGLRLAFKV